MEDTFKIIRSTGEQHIVFGKLSDVRRSAIEAWGEFAINIVKANRPDIVLHKFRNREIPSVERWLKEYKDK